MRYLSSNRQVNAWYIALSRANDKSRQEQNFPFHSFRMMMQWDKGQLVQYFEVKINDNWICDIRNDNGKFCVEQWGIRFEKEFNKNLVKYIKDFIACLVECLEQEFNFDYSY